VTTPTTATGIRHYKQALLINAIDVVDDNNGGKLFLALVGAATNTCVPAIFSPCVLPEYYISDS